MVTDRASSHRAKFVKKLLRKNKNIRIIYLPKRSPYLNAVKKCWRQGKHALLVSECYWTFADMCEAITAYYKTARFKPDISNLPQKRGAMLHELLIATITKVAQTCF